MKAFFLLPIVLIMITELCAQDRKDTTNASRQYIIVKTMDDSEIKGYFVSRSKDFLIIDSDALGEVKIANEKIKRITSRSGKAIMDNSKNTESNTTDWFANPNPSRYLYTPSAIALKKGDFYLQNIYVLIGGVQYGVSDKFSIGGGTSISTLFGVPAFYLTPKYTFYSREKKHAAVGLLFFGLSNGWNDTWNTAGILYGSGTLGDTERNMTLGVGYGFIEGRPADLPTISLAGQMRITRRISLVTENWLIPNVNSSGSYYGLFSYGVRFLSESFAIDLAMINNPDIASFSPIGIPFLGVMIKF